MSTDTFKKIIWDFYKKQGRTLPWRQTRDPYRICVSEFMLQQTQVDRVIMYYDAFLKKFPTVDALAKAPFGDVLRVWQGLGYNRRAKFLHMLAKVIVENHGSKFPRTHEALMTLPGVGQSTAGAIMAFAWGKSSVFIETNIRRVFIHFFFADKTNVRDSDIRKLVEETRDQGNPREWYYALMDYGSTLPKVVSNPNRKSKHYKKQPAFKGSKREVRGAIIRSLSIGPALTYQAILRSVPEHADTKGIVAALEREGFIRKVGMRYTLA